MKLAEDLCLATGTGDHKNGGVRLQKAAIQEWAKARPDTDRWGADGLGLVSWRGSWAEAEDVGDGQGGGVGVVFAERGFVAAVHFHFEGADVEIELGFGAAFEMLGSDDTDTGGEEFVVEIVHGKGRAGINKEDAARIIFAKGCFAPLARLLAPLIGAGFFNQAQILQGGCVVFLNVREVCAGRVEIEDAKWRRAGIARV